jgi:hypothetical protein
MKEKRKRGKRGEREERREEEVFSVSFHFFGVGGEARSRGEESKLTHPTLEMISSISAHLLVP